MGNIKYSTGTYDRLAFTTEVMPFTTEDGRRVHQVVDVLEDDDLMSLWLGFDVHTGNYRDYLSEMWSVKHPRLSFISLLMLLGFDPTAVFDGNLSLFVYVEHSPERTTKEVRDMHRIIKAEKKVVDLMEQNLVLDSELKKVGILYSALNKELDEEGYTDKYDALKSEIYKIVKIQKPRKCKQ